MRTFSAFSAAGKWFRGNCHCHTTLSDGRQTAAELVEVYRKRGYDFLVLTDHGRDQEDPRSLQRPGLLVINGAELHPPVKAAAPESHHIVGIGMKGCPSEARVKRATARWCIDWIHRNGGIAVYAPPYWSGHAVDSMTEGTRAFGMEAFNTVTEAKRGLGDSSVHLDQMLGRGVRWRVFAADDTHRAERDAGGAWIMVKAKTLTRSGIMSAIRKGHFYASCGPEIRSLSFSRGVARIECSPVRKIGWYSYGPRGLPQTDRRGSLTEGEFSVKALPETAFYLRVEITDAKGRKAWANPIWRDKKTGRWGD